MNRLRTFVVVGLSALCVACTEAAGPTAPVPATIAAAAQPGDFHATLAPDAYPHVASEAAGASYGLAYIIRISPVVYWEGAYANASSAMDYFGNHGNQTLTLRVNKDATSLPPTTATSNDEHLIPAEYHMVTSGFGTLVSGTCGWIANLDAAGTAQILLFVDVKGLTVLSTATGSASKGRPQPTCAPKTCTTTASNDLSSAYGGDFDPYEFASSTSPCGGGAMDGNASGTQFKPGDHTGGETVDWSTGRGNGGASSCGTAAQVEFACVEYYVQGEGWKDLGCGYVTTC